MDEKALLLDKAVQECRKAMRVGFFSDVHNLVKVVEKMKSVSEEIPTLQKAVESKTGRKKASAKLSWETDPWTPPMSAEMSPGNYENEKAFFYGTSEVIATYSKASASIAAALKTLESVRLMPGLLDAETKNGVRHLKRTIKSMEVAEHVIDDAMNSTYFDHTV